MKRRNEDEQFGDKEHKNKGKQDLSHYICCYDRIFFCYDRRDGGEKQRAVPPETAPGL